MKATNEFHGGINLRLVLVVEFDASGYEAGDLPALDRILVHERRIEPQLARDAERVRFRCAVDERIGSDAGMPIDVCLTCAREAKRLVGKARRHRRDIDDIPPIALKRRADAFDYPRIDAVKKGCIESRVIAHGIHPPSCPAFETRGGWYRARTSRSVEAVDAMLQKTNA